MNGRIFDPTLGMFMQADPMIQDPLNLQNYDRYTYCYNNPLTCTDPSGHEVWNQNPDGSNSYYNESGQNTYTGGNTLADYNSGYNWVTAQVNNAFDIAFGSHTVAGVSNGTPFGGTGSYAGDAQKGGPTTTPLGSGTNMGDSFRSDFNKGASGGCSVLDPGTCSSVGAKVGSWADKYGWDLPSAVPLFGGLWDWGSSAIRGDGTGMLLAVGTIGLDITTFGTEGTAVRLELAASRAVAKEGLADAALVCRGGACKAENFISGSGVTRAADGTLSGVSTQSAAGESLSVLAKPFKNNQVGVTTAGDIRAAGGRITADGHPGNPNHATIDGLTGAQLESLFSPTVKNPVPPAFRGY